MGIKGGDTFVITLKTAKFCVKIRISSMDVSMYFFHLRKGSQYEVMNNMGIVGTRIAQRDS